MALRVSAHGSPDDFTREAAAILEARLQRYADACEIEILIGAEAISAGGASFADAALAAPGSYCVSQSFSDARLRVLLAGSGRGTSYAAYAWLERQGWSFHLHGDVEPEPDAPLDRTSFVIARRPRFAWRGIQLWNYWWPGRDSWGYAEYAAYLDQFPKLGLNHFEFPLYWYEPLFTGACFEGVPLRRLPLSGADVTLARVGGESLAGHGRFTSPDIPDDASDDERSRAAQQLLRRVFAHAKSLGLRTTVGIELGNVYLIDPSMLARLPPEDRYEGGLLVQPSSMSGRSLARARLEALFDAFPDVDTYAIWQMETGPARRTAGSPHPEDVAFRSRHSRYSDRVAPGDFDQLQWIRLATGIAAEIRPGARIATGGWGAERLMVAADDTLGPQVIRATIADYEPEFGLRRNAFDAYAATSGERWHATWAEVDQHLWIQQTKIAATGRVLDELERRGIDGVSQVHWRLLFPDPDIYCFVRGCWTGTGGPDSLRLSWARAKCGPAAAGAVADGLAAIEAFNHSIVDRTPDILHSAWWVGFECFMGGLLSANRYLDAQGLSAAFASDYATPLLESAGEADRHLSAAVAHFDHARSMPGSERQERRLAFWASRATYSRDLYRAHVHLARACLKLSEGQDQESLRDALRQIEGARAEEVVRGFASLLAENGEPDRGELGLLLSLNVKFLGSVRRFEGAIRRLLAPQECGAPLGVLDVIAGSRLPRREYGTYWELLHVATQPWSPGDDSVHAAPGFGYVLLRGSSGRLSPAAGVWSDPELVEFRLSAPPGWRGTLQLYFYQELDWDTPFRVQAIEIEGTRKEQVRDFYGRGPHCDEGLWREYPVVFPEDGNLRVSIVRLGGGDARLSRLVLKA